MRSKIPLQLTVLALAAHSAVANAAVLGAVRGPVHLGQPLDVAVEVQLSLDDERSNFCLEGEIWYGDNRKFVGLLTLPSTLPKVGQGFAVRIQHSATVDEPVVTVQLKDKCTGKTTRRYVLLADPLPSPSTDKSATPLVSTSPLAAPGPAVVAAATPVTSGAVSTSAVTDAPNTAATGTVTATANTDSASKTDKSAAPTASKPTAKAVAPAAEKKPHRPTLQVTALDGLTPPAPKAKPTAPAAIAAPQPAKPDPNEAVWSALNEQAQQAEQAAERIAQLEKLVTQLTERDKLQQQNLQLAVQALQAKRDDPVGTPIVLALSAVMVAMLGAMAWLWRQNRRLQQESVPWWNDAQTAQTDARPHTNLSDLPAASALSGHDKLAETTHQAIAPESAPIPVGATQVAGLVTSQGTPSQAAVFTPASIAPPASAPTPLTWQQATPLVENNQLLHSAELDDLRQQADFFMALGEHDEAIAILEQQIRERPRSAPGLYLDLLKALHLLGRRVHFEQYRAQFETVFMGVVPSFEDWDVPRDVLEEFPDVCQGIAVRWPQMEALEYISGILCVGSPLATHRFPLGAVQELLYLNDLLRFMVFGEQEGQRISTSFGKLDLIID